MLIRSLASFIPSQPSNRPGAFPAVLILGHHRRHLVRQEAPTWPDATSSTTDHSSGSTGVMLASSQSKSASNPCRYPPPIQLHQTQGPMLDSLEYRRGGQTHSMHTTCPVLLFSSSPLRAVVDRRVVTCITPFVPSKRPTCPTSSLAAVFDFHPLLLLLSARCACNVVPHNLTATLTHFFSPPLTSP